MRCQLLATHRDNRWWKRPYNTAFTALTTAIVAGGTGGSLFSLDLFRPGQTATAAMTALATGSDQVKGEALTFESLFFVGFLLFLLTLALNILSERTVRRLRRRF